MGVHRMSRRRSGERGRGAEAQCATLRAGSGSLGPRPCPLFLVTGTFEIAMPTCARVQLIPNFPRVWSPLSTLEMR